MGFIDNAKTFLNTPRSITLPTLNSVKTLFRSKSSTLSQPSQWLSDLFGGSKTKSGINVNPDSAMSFSAVFSAVDGISRDLSTLPIHLFRKEGEYRFRADHPSLKVLNSMANPVMSSIIFFRVMDSYLLRYGKALAEIVYDKNGAIKELWPLHPDDVRVEMKNYTLHFTFIPNSKEIPTYKMLYIPGYTNDGVNCLSPIGLHREGIGLAFAAESFGAKFFANGTHVGGFVSHPGKLSDEAFQRLTTEFNNEYKGLNNSHGVMILEEGQKFEKIALPLADCEYVNIRKFSNLEVSRIYHYPAHKMGELDNATFTNIEEQNKEYAINTLLPWICLWEQILNNTLLSDEERETLYFKFNYAGLLRADIKTRYEAYDIGLRDGFINRDEVRAFEDLNPMDNKLGQIFTVPMNWCDLADLKMLSEPDPEQKQLIRQPEKRKKNNYLLLRRKIGTRYKGKIQSKISDILADEIETIRNALDKESDFSTWMKQFYNSEYKESLSKELQGVFSSFAESISDIALEEANSEEDISVRLEKFVKSYSAGFATRYVFDSTGQLKSLLKTEDPSLEINNRLNEWEEKRVKKITDKETTKSRNAFTKIAWQIAGITKIRSVANGKSCPYCNDLHGKVIGISGTFLSKGDELSPDGEEALKINSNISHPPYHGGCDCDIEPGD